MTEIEFAQCCGGVSVKDRLPEVRLADPPEEIKESDWVLAFVEGRGWTVAVYEVIPVTRQFHTEEKSTWYDELGNQLSGVTHWMPLPLDPSKEK